MATWPDGLTLVSQGGTFRGWSLNPRAGVDAAAATTMSGIGLGSTRDELEAAYAKAEAYCRDVRQYSVSPGNFVIDDLYPTGYGGDLEVSVVEADGRRREFKARNGL